MCIKYNLMYIFVINKVVMSHARFVHQSAEVFTEIEKVKK